MNRIETLGSLINLEDPDIKQLYNAWDKGDCSEVGLCEILLAQIISEHRVKNGSHSDSDYDEIKLRYNIPLKIKYVDEIIQRNIDDCEDLDEAADDPLTWVDDRYREYLFTFKGHTYSYMVVDGTGTPEGGTYAHVEVSDIKLIK